MPLIAEKRLFLQLAALFSPDSYIPGSGKSIFTSRKKAFPTKVKRTFDPTEKHGPAGWKVFFIPVKEEIHPLPEQELREKRN